MSRAIERAERAGYEASLRRDPRIPAFDSELLELISDMEVGSGASDLMEAWYRGYERQATDGISEATS